MNQSKKVVEKRGNEVFERQANVSAVLQQDGKREAQAVHEYRKHGATRVAEDAEVTGEDAEAR